MIRATLLICLLLPCLAGCPVFQSQDTPVPQRKLTNPTNGKTYWLYVPSYYTADRDWPLVITLHGTFGFDSASDQIREWKALAEKRGFIVAAPHLRSVQGILPVIRPIWYDDLADDENTILSLLAELKRRYRIARDPAAGKDLVMLTGFSAGGYPMYYTGLRNPEKFSVLVARACNSDSGVFKHVEVTQAVRRLRVIIFYGKGDLPFIANQSWDAFRWLRVNGCLRAERHKISGGHMRRPDRAWAYWADYLPRAITQRPPGR